MLSDDDEVLDPFVNTLVLGDGVDVPPFPDVLSGLPPPPFTALTVLTVLVVLTVFVMVGVSRNVTIRHNYLYTKLYKSPSFRFSDLYTSNSPPGYLAFNFSTFISIISSNVVSSAIHA